MSPAAGLIRVAAVRVPVPVPGFGGLVPVPVKGSVPVVPAAGDTSEILSENFTNTVKIRSGGAYRRAVLS